MNESFFAGSYGGNNQNITESSRLECKICWYVYDPQAGDDYWQIPAGTPFSELPDHWTCPICDGVKSGFMILSGNADA